MISRREWRFRSFFDRRFAISASGSTPWRETIAGITTFAAMMYVIAVNPTVMAASGMDRHDVASATMIVALFGCVLTGLFANLPIGLAPSMGSNAFFVFVMVGKFGWTWRTGLAVILCTGLITLALSLLRIREALVRAVPEELKIGLQVSFGLFIMSVALHQGGAAAGGITEPPVLLAAGGLAAAMLLVSLRVPGALLLSIVFTTLAGAWVPAGDGGMVTALPAAFVAWPRWPQQTFLALDFSEAGVHFWRFLITVLFVTLSECVGLLATTVTVMRMTGRDPPQGLMPGTTAAFASDASATILGALLGTATVSPYVESVAGVQAGGRTGLTALVAAAGFGVALAFWPVIAAVPPQATAPALAIIGLSMISQGIARVDRRTLAILPGLSMALVTLVTRDLVDALAAGSFIYFVTRIGRGGASLSGWLLVGLILMLWSAAKLLT